MSFKIGFFFQSGKLYSLTSVLMPGIDEGSATEIYLNAIYLIITSVIISGVSLLCVQITTGITCVTIKVTSIMIVLEMEKLSEHLERNDLERIKVRKRVKRDNCALSITTDSIPN